MDPLPPTEPRLRYVVLRHEGIDDPHFDLMFETDADAPLATWRAERWPLAPGDQPARIADHRREYLDYEGTVPGDRGRVRRVAAGRHRIERNNADELLTRLDHGAALRLRRSRAGKSSGEGFRRD